jgi:hypothetical protein
MRKFIETMFLFFALVCAAQLQSQESFITVLDKNESFVSPEPDVVVMDKYTFCSYQYTSDQYDTLKQSVIVYEEAITQQECIRDSIANEYETLIAFKNTEIKEYSDGYEKTKGLLREQIASDEKLQVDYIKLKEKNQRVKKHRNFFIGTSVVLSAFLVLILVH